MEAFDHGSYGPDVRAETDRRAPIDTVAPARWGEADGSNSGGEVQGSVGRKRRRVLGRGRRGDEASRKRWREEPGPMVGRGRSSSSPED